MHSIKKHNILLIYSLVLILLAFDLIFIFLLELECIKYLYLINIVCIVLLYFYFFGKRWHPVFVFLGTLILFQGSIILFGNYDELTYVTLMGANLTLKPQTVRLTLLTIILSTWAVIIGGIIGNNKKNRNLAKKIDNSEKIIFIVLLFISMPFFAYKQLNYFSYFLKYGYLGFYQSISYLSEVGLLPRLISFIFPITVQILFFLEKSKKNILCLLFIYFVLTLPFLISGFRGQFFTLWLTIFIFYKYRFDNRLKYTSLIFLISMISFSGLFISSFREGIDINFIELFSKNPILEFFKQQGVSYYVTAMAIEFKDEFAPKILYYLTWEPVSAISSKALSVPGRSFATDLMMKINYLGYTLGYGTGSSYIAEAYLLGGLPSVLFISFLIGYVLSKLFDYFKYVNVFLKVIIFTFIQYTLFLPRDLLLMPISQIIKVGVYLLFLVPFVNIIKRAVLINKATIKISRKESTIRK